MPKKVVEKIGAYFKFRNPENYQTLKLADDQDLDYIFNNNIWNLKTNFAKLQEHIRDTNKDDNIAFLNKVYLLDNPNKTSYKFDKISLKDFKEGKYNSKGVIGQTTNKPATEKAYAERVIFFAKVLPSFIQYQNSDNIEWVVLNNNKLLYEIIKYHNDNNHTISTVYRDLKTIVRVIAILLGDHELRYKFNNLSTDLKLLEQMGENFNKVQSKSEINTFIPYEQLLEIADELEKQYYQELNKLSVEKRADGKKHSNHLYHLHQLLLVLTLNIWDYPSRLDKFQSVFITNDKDAKNEGVYIDVSNPVCRFIFNNDTKKHKPLTYSLDSETILGLNNRLNKLLHYSYKTYPRTNVFISKNGWEKNNLKGVSTDTVSVWLKDIVIGKNIGINGIRSAFISYYWNKLNNNQKNILLTRIRSSKEEIERNYLKQYQSPDDLIKVKLEPNEELYSKVSAGTNKETAWIVDDNGNIPVVIPKLVSLNIPQLQQKPVQQKPVVNIHNRKNENAKKYYQENKEKILKKIKETVNNLDVVAGRYCRELNKGMLDWNRLQDSTKQKFQLYKQGVEFKSKLLN